MKRSPALLSALLLLSVAAGAGGLAPAAALAQPPKDKAGEPLPAGVAAEAMPPGAAEVADAVKTAKPGQAVTVRGRIAMSKDAFAAGRPAFTLTDDAAAATCCPADGTLMDTCPAPAEKKVTVQLVDRAGKPLSGALEGKGGLRHGAEVFVVGTVAEGAGDGPVVINATGVHVPRGGLPAGFFAGETPKDAKDVAAAKKAGLKKGDTVALRGVIGGSHDPFVKGRAMFTLMGSGLKPCNANPDDHCETPWDYCCETKADIAANAATVRVVDEKGNPLRTDIKGRRGIKELSEVVVVGTVVSAEKGTLVVDATRIHPVAD